jgi:hypothetical protein
LSHPSLQQGAKLIRTEAAKFGAAKTEAAKIEAARQKAEGVVTEQAVPQPENAT